jgi:hypothetical protein
MSALVTALNGSRDPKVSRRAEGLAWIAAGLFASPPASRRGPSYQRVDGPKGPDSKPRHEPHMPVEIPPESPTSPPMPEHIPAGDPPQKRELGDLGPAYY